MTEARRTLAVTAVGAVLGGLAGYLFFTDRGRTLRQQIEPALERLTRELNEFRGTLAKTASVANEGWKVLNEALGEDHAPAPRYTAHPHQTSPF